MDPEDLTDLISSDSEKESEDKQLRRAVQLSLQQQPDTRNDETSDELRIPDEEDEQLKLAIELSLKCQGVDESHEDQGPQNELRGAKNDPFKRESSPLKRSASGSDTHSHKRVKSLDNPDYDEAEYPTLDKEKSESPIREAGLLHRLGNPVFPGGVVKKTWAFGYPREDDIKIEEVLQSPKLKTAVLSSFQWDADWLFNKIDCKRTSVTLIMDENEAQAPMIHAKYKRIAICGPKNVIGIMHSKLMLLFYENYARIVIPTANLVPHDWGETGVMENMVFLIDLPYLSEGVAKFPAGGDRAARSMITKTGPFTKFFEGLHIFCTWMNLKPHILDQLCRCDFTATKDMAFVFGAGTVLRGNNDRSDLAYMGIPGLAYQVKELGLYSHDDLQVDFVASSVGQLVFDFVPELYLACHGTDRSRVVEWQEAHAVDSSDSEGNKNQKPPEPTTVLGLGIKSKKYSKSQIEAIVKSNLRVYFPSYETVQNSSGGPNAAGTICLTKKCWDAAMFPRELFYDCKSAREGLLMHNKMIFVQPIQKQATPASKSARAWVYVGSANCSASAWARGRMDRGTPIVSGRNWECGVIIPLPRISECTPDDASKTDDTEMKETQGVSSDRARLDGLARSGLNQHENRSLDVFLGVVPIPISLPADRLSENNGPKFMNG